MPKFSNKRIVGQVRQLPEVLSGIAKKHHLPSIVEGESYYSEQALRDLTGSRIELGNLRAMISALWKKSPDYKAWENSAEKKTLDETKKTAETPKEVVAAEKAISVLKKARQQVWVANNKDEAIQTLGHALETARADRDESYRALTKSLLSEYNSEQLKFMISYNFCQFGSRLIDHVESLGGKNLLDLLLYLPFSDPAKDAAKLSNKFIKASDAEKSQMLKRPNKHEEKLMGGGFVDDFYLLVVTAKLAKELNIFDIEFDANRYLKSIIDMLLMTITQQPTSQLLYDTMLAFCELLNDLIHRIEDKDDPEMLVDMNIPGFHRGLKIGLDQAFKINLDAMDVPEGHFQNSALKQFSIDFVGHLLTHSDKNLENAEEMARAGELSTNVKGIHEENKKLEEDSAAHISQLVKAGKAVEAALDDPNVDLNKVIEAYRTVIETIKKAKPKDLETKHEEAVMVCHKTKEGREVFSFLDPKQLKKERTDLQDEFEAIICQHQQTLFLYETMIRANDAGSIAQHFRKVRRLSANVKDKKALAHLKKQNQALLAQVAQWSTENDHTPVFEELTVRLQKSQEKLDNKTHEFEDKAIEDKMKKLQELKAAVSETEAKVENKKAEMTQLEDDLPKLERYIALTDEMNELEATRKEIEVTQNQLKVQNERIPGLIEKFNPENSERPIDLTENSKDLPESIQSKITDLERRYAKKESPSQLKRLDPNYQQRKSVSIKETKEEIVKKLRNLNNSNVESLKKHAEMHKSTSDQIIVRTERRKALRLKGITLKKAEAQRDEKCEALNAGEATLPLLKAELENKKKEFAQSLKHFSEEAPEMIRKDLRQCEEGVEKIKNDLGEYDLESIATDLSECDFDLARGVENESELNKRRSELLQKARKLLKQSNAIFKPKKHVVFIDEGYPEYLATVKTLIIKIKDDFIPTLAQFKKTYQEMDQIAEWLKQLSDVNKDLPKSKKRKAGAKSTNERFTLLNGELIAVKTTIEKDITAVIAKIILPQFNKLNEALKQETANLKQYPINPNEDVVIDKMSAKKLLALVNRKRSHQAQLDLYQQYGFDEMYDLVGKLFLFLKNQPLDTEVPDELANLLMTLDGHRNKITEDLETTLERSETACQQEDKKLEKKLTREIQVVELHKNFKALLKERQSKMNRFQRLVSRIVSVVLSVFSKKTAKRKWTDHIDEATNAVNDYVLRDQKNSLTKVIEKLATEYPKEKPVESTEPAKPPAKGPQKMKYEFKLLVQKIKPASKGPDWNAKLGGVLEHAKTTLVR